MSVDARADVAGNAPVSTTALDARPEGGARAARQRRHADDGARRADRGRDRHGVLRRVHRRRRRSCATRRAARAAKYIFNVRASYAQEARATIELFKKKRRHRLHAPDLVRPERHVRPGRLRRPRRRRTRTSIGAFPGSADPTTPIARFRYTRNDDTSVPAQAAAAEAYLAQPAQQHERHRSRSA